MKTVLALRHVHFEDLGTLEPVLRERGYAIRYVDPSVEGVAGLGEAEADLLVVLGGPIGAFDEQAYPWLLDELQLIHDRLTRGRPTLGICLGAQLMARALGARVYPMGVKEIGFGELALTEEGRASALSALGRTPVLHWHGDQFDIPAGARRLAATAIGPNQAFALGDHALGLQFHLEADVRALEHWLVGHASELAQAGIDPRVLRAQAQGVRSILPAAARAVLSNWLDGQAGA